MSRRVQAREQRSMGRQGQRRCRQRSRVAGSPPGQRVEHGGPRLLGPINSKVVRAGGVEGDQDQRRRFSVGGEQIEGRGTAERSTGSNRGSGNEDKLLQVPPTLIGDRVDCPLFYYLGFFRVPLWDG